MQKWVERTDELNKTTDSEMKAVLESSSATGLIRPTPRLKLDDELSIDRELPSRLRSRTGRATQSLSK